MNVNRPEETIFDPWLLQDDVLKDFRQEGGDQWTTVYRQEYESERVNSGIYCALAPTSYRDTALSNAGWDLSICDYRPGFLQYYDGNQETTVYHRLGGVEPLEPLVLSREFHGARPSNMELCEEFRLYHNLYWDTAKSSFIKPYEDGTSEIAVEVSKDLVRIRTKLLRQYQAARQMDLLLFIDSVRRAEPVDVELPPDLELTTSDLRATRHSGDHTSPPFTRLLATKVIPSPTIEHSGIWPYESSDEYFPDFIIDLDKDGKDVRYSCNPDSLSNYFGANPDAPHYLTPVHFRKEVLKKYYDASESYEVSDGFLQCAALWRLRIDNDHADRVIVFLGDLGRDLPRVERDYWRSFNIAPDSKLSETGYRRAILGEFADPQSADLCFRAGYDQFVRDWPIAAGWSMYRKPVGPDQSLLKQVRLPLDDSENEFKKSIESLALLMCDGLNDAELNARLPKGPPDEKSIGKLERWLTQEGYEEVARDIKLLKDIQKLRSTGVVHLKGMKYDAIRSKILGSEGGHAGILALLSGCTQMLDDLIRFATTQKSRESNDGEEDLEDRRTQS